MNRLKSQLHFLHVIKGAKQQDRRALLASADVELIKNIVECDINTLNGNHKVSKDEKGKLKKNKNRLLELLNPKIRFKSNRKHLVQKGGFVVPLLPSIFSDVIGTIINTHN